MVLSSKTSKPKTPLLSSQQTKSKKGPRAGCCQTSSVVKKEPSSRAEKFAKDMGQKNAKSVSGPKKRSGCCTGREIVLNPHLGKSYRANPDNHYVLGIDDAKVDLDLVSRITKIASKDPTGELENQLGYCYYKGFGGVTKQNKSKAKALFAKSSKKQWSDGILNYAFFLGTHEKKPKEIKRLYDNIMIKAEHSERTQQFGEAKRLYLMAALGGQNQVYTKLALMIINQARNNEDQRVEIARRCLELGIQQGDREAAKTLASINKRFGLEEKQANKKVIKPELSKDNKKQAPSSIKPDNSSGKSKV